MSKSAILREKNLSRLDRQILHILQDVAPEWKSRREISRIIGGNINPNRIASLKSLEFWRLIESRQTGTANKIRWEYRAKVIG